jgi:hypothetical protein
MTGVNNKSSTFMSLFSICAMLTDGFTGFCHYIEKILLQATTILKVCDDGILVSVQVVVNQKFLTLNVGYLLNQNSLNMEN